MEFAEHIIDMMLPSFTEASKATTSSELQLYRKHNRLTPVYSLPRELLSLIMRIGQNLELYPFRDPDDVCLEDSTALFEVRISHVSSHFRHVAIGTRLLWASITSDRPMEETLTYISRSKGCWLDVHLKLDGFEVSSPRLFANVDTILHQAHCCSRLSIDTPCETREKPIIQFLNGLYAPALEHLSISVEGVQDIGAMKFGVFMGGAPKLSFVRLRGLAMSLFCPPLYSVTTLHLDQTLPLPISYTTFRQMLTASPILENLSVFGDIIPLQSWHTDKPVDVPNLHCLRICGVGGAIYSGLLLGINAPALESLVLKDLQEHDLDQFWASPHMTKFPFLRYLAFCDFEVSGSVYRRFFEAFPAVTGFTTTHCTSTPGIFLQLAQLSTQRDLLPWPNLQTLASFINSDDRDLIIDVIKKRSAVGCPFQRLRLGTTQSYESILRECGRLGEQMTLEIFSQCDPWPLIGPSAGVSDPDDYLFI